MARVCAFLALVLAVPTTHAAPDLTGPWQKSPASALERYTIAAAGPALFAVTCVDSCGWKHANISALDAVNLHVVFDNGANHDGALSSTGASIAWADGSGWARMRPAGDRIVVHV